MTDNKIRFVILKKLEDLSSELKKRLPNAGVFVASDNSQTLIIYDPETGNDYEIEVSFKNLGKQTYRVRVETYRGKTGQQMFDDFTSEIDLFSTTSIYDIVTAFKPVWIYLKSKFDELVSLYPELKTYLD